MCDYTSEEIQEVYRQQRKRKAAGEVETVVYCPKCEGYGVVGNLACYDCNATGVAPNPMRTMKEALKAIQDNTLIAIEAASRGVNYLTGQPFNNWGTNERA